MDARGEQGLIQQLIAQPAIKKARERGIRFGRKPLLIPATIQEVMKLRKAGKTVPEIMHQMALSKASVYRALGADKAARAS